MDAGCLWTRRLASSPSPLLRPNLVSRSPPRAYAEVENWVRCLGFRPGQALMLCKRGTMMSELQLMKLKKYSGWCRSYSLCSAILAGVYRIPSSVHGHVAVSTNGFVPQLKLFLHESNCALAVSLNATTDEVRNWIMPILGNTIPSSGGAMNLVRTLGPAVAAGNYRALWIYLVAPILGALAGAGTYTVVKLREDEVEVPLPVRGFRR
ncbi:hypothetical protein MLD38_003395 [Melastoma candidum]|uniref:Uncharacterized protein n=1 Tax=Melastoma candidum TaxID=119954 RepID=A0ACB9S402_9MYRT|nr:hypothetical protein MLD38_003395 [Melastoma candidum]